MGLEDDGTPLQSSPLARAPGCLRRLSYEQSLYLWASSHPR